MLLFVDTTSYTQHFFSFREKAIKIVTKLFAHLLLADTHTNWTHCIKAHTSTYIYVMQNWFSYMGQKFSFVDFIRGKSYRNEEQDFQRNCIKANFVSN